MTQQSPDRLRYDGKDYSLDEFVLGSYLLRHPEQHPQPKSALSCLWRGYIASFAIRDGLLWLDEIQTPPEPDSELHDHLRALLPAEEPCAWFTGLLPLERSTWRPPIRIKRIKGVRQRVEPLLHPRQVTHELLQLEAGRVVHHWRLTPDQHDRFCEEQRVYFRMSPDYEAAREVFRRKWKVDDEQLERIIDYNILFLTSTLYVEPADFGQ